MSVRSLLVVVVLVMIGCSAEFSTFDASSAHDAGAVSDEGASIDGGVPAGALFTIAGCDKLTFDGTDRPSCIVGVDRPLTFIPLGAGVDTFVWQFTSGTPATSGLLSPTVTWSAFGSYTVTLAAGGSGGSAMALGTVQISASAAGAACTSDDDCDSTMGLSCLCGSDDNCPAGLAAGICIRRCETTGCGTGEVCIDLERGVGNPLPDGGMADGGAVAGQDFRVRACLPTCTTSAACRSGFACRTLPEVAVGAPLDGTYTWTQACFASVLGDVGDSCDDVNGNPDDSRCTTGHCEKLGARGVCSDTCSTSTPCPSNTECATMPSIGERCLATCTTSCDDPLLACETAGAGGLGFTLPSSAPTGTMLCAEKRCSADTDCAPAGTCVSVGGGLFCQPAS